MDQLFKKRPSLIDRLGGASRSSNRSKRCGDAFGATSNEGPVILIRSALRSLQRAGMDVENPNTFWNRPPEDWVPEGHGTDLHNPDRCPHSL
ncbi:hypothetical protein [Ruegeria sp. HKCCA4812]|uniref:hypothetical protein n=1 Tax=Ruegeria sp. HKCCA4812 TaxID=2682993 RepID=UPI001488EA31|nr:hypothetical protein [Ruegeria sp. HKCCA4812]